MSKSSDTIDLIKEMLERTIAFKPILKRITGSTEAALFLSQAWYWSTRTKSKDGYFYKTIREWDEETGLTRKEQDRARRILKNMMIIKTQLRGVPATTFYLVDHSILLQHLQFALCGQTGLSYADKLVCPMPTKRTVGMGQTGLSYASKPVCLTGPNINKESEITSADVSEITSMTSSSTSAQTTGDDAADVFLKTLKAAGITRKDSIALKEQGITTADILAELARCYNDETVRKPNIIAPINLKKGNFAPANWYQDDHLKDCIPHAILRVARPDLFIQESEIPAANEEATEEPAEDVTPVWWKQIDAQLSADMPRTNYHKYVEPAHAALTGNIINITTPNPDWLSARLESTIRHLAAGVLNMPDIQVQFVQG